MNGDPRRFGIDDGRGPSNEDQEDEPHPSDLCEMCGDRPKQLSREYDKFPESSDEELTEEVCRSCYKAAETTADRSGVEAAATSSRHHARSQEEFVRNFMFQQGWAMDVKKDEYDREADPTEDDDE